MCRLEERTAIVSSIVQVKDLVKFEFYYGHFIRKTNCYEISLIFSPSPASLLKQNEKAAARGKCASMTSVLSLALALDEG